MFLIASNDKMLARVGVYYIPVCAQAQDTNPLDIFFWTIDWYNLYAKLVTGCEIEVCAK